MASLSTLLALIFLVCFSHPHPSYSDAIRVHNVVSYGAKPDGTTDSTSAFLNAWGAACASANASTITVPKGTFLLASLAFDADYCKTSHITFCIHGTLVAAPVLPQPTTWLSFHGVTGVSIFGGTLDAKGPPLWACKASTTNCPTGATVHTNFSYFIYHEHRYIYSSPKFAYILFIFFNL